MLTALLSLWLPILVSAVVVWIASAIIWMAMPHHKRDRINLPDQEAMIQFVRSHNIPPGNYVFPYCGDAAQRNSPAMKEAIERGPIGTLSLWPTPMKMGPKMLATFLVYLAVSIFLAYLASITIEPHANHMRVFRIVGTGGILAYCFAFIPNAVWFGGYLRTIVACIIDGIFYGLITAAIFAWLWPR